MNEINGMNGMDEMDRMRKKKKIIYLAFLILFLLGFLASMFFLLRGKMREKKEQTAYEQLAEQVTSGAADSGGLQRPQTGGEGEGAEMETEMEIPDLGLDWETLKQRNEHIYSWIYLPGTNINYPVVQHPKELNYYLRHDLAGSDAVAGCIYTQYLNQRDYSDQNTVVYGHNMKNGSMFQNLHQFEDKSFMEENRYIYIYLPDKTLVYEIYRAGEFSDVLIPNKYDVGTEEGTKGFLEDFAAYEGTSQTCEGMEAPGDGRILTLSTCIGGRDSERWLVVGVLVYEEGIT